MHTYTKPRILSATTAIGDNVVNAEGEVLGEIKEIMFDVPTGTIEYAVLAFDQGFLAELFDGSKLFAVPWQMLTLQPESHSFLMNVDRETLENAPGFDKENWPAHADPYWTTELHNYYNQYRMRV